MLELRGYPNAQCKIKNGQELVGNFTVPSIVNLGPEVGKVETNCTFNNNPVVSRIELTDHRCQDQIVVKGPCPKATSTVKSVAIIISHSK